jgi:hypothetical protein
VLRQIIMISIRTQKAKGEKDKQTTLSCCLVNDIIKVDNFLACLQHVKPFQIFRCFMNDENLFNLNDFVSLPESLI